MRAGAGDTSNYYFLFLFKNRGEIWFASKFFSEKGGGLHFLGLGGLHWYFLLLGAFIVLTAVPNFALGLFGSGKRDKDVARNSVGGDAKKSKIEVMTPWTKRLTAIFFCLKMLHASFWIMGQQVNI